MNLSTKFHWQPNWKTLLFVAVFLPTTIMLGFWQLDRAEQKREILANQERQQQLAPLTNSDWRESKENHLRRVDLQMNLNPEHYILLANRTMNGRVGYEVISLGQLTDSSSEGDLQLVNRGWLPASLDRNELPEISTPLGEQTVSGYYYCPEPNGLIRQSTEFSGSWPAVVFSLDQTAMEQIFGTADQPLPCEIRVDPLSPLAFVVDWQIVNQSVQKHIGYAVQWFLMAFALIILALFSNSNLGMFFRRAKTK